MTQRRFATYNLMDMFAGDDQAARYAQVAEVVAGLRADVVAVQELTAATQPVAEAQVARLAEMTGMTATVTAGGQRPVHAAGAGGNRFAVGLLWRNSPAIVARPDTLRVYGAASFFHSLVKLTLTVDGAPITFASWHACPIGKYRRADEAERVISAIGRAGPALLGCDGNTIGYATVTAADGTRQFYDDDPYAKRPWQPGFVHTCTWEDDAGVIRSHHADRAAARILAAGGLHDVAPTLGERWAPTAGHHPDDALGMDRRLDYVHATTDLLSRLIAYEVVDTALARTASDHLPAVATWTSQP